MPRGASWPGGAGLGRMDGLDSVVRATPGDGLEHLSAEEKACLLFLEETIDSLDSEGDSTLSTQESDHLSNPRKFANVLNGLLASASKHKDSQQTPAKEKESTDVTPVQTGVVPVPPTVASKPPCASSTPEPGVTSGDLLLSAPLSADSSKPPDPKLKNPAPPLPQLEEPAPIPPRSKPRDGLWKTAEGPAPRGPLSYDALVHLRKSTSTKTPLCPTVDHTIDSGKGPSAPVGGLKLGSDRPRPLAAAAKCPPPVAPKPKIVPRKASVESDQEAAIPSDPIPSDPIPSDPIPSDPIPSDPIPSDPLQHVMNPEVVRLEALRKLGLLKETEAEGDTLGPLPPLKSRSFLYPKASRCARSPSRSTSFGSARVPPTPENRPLQSSAAFQLPVPAGCPERLATKQRPRDGSHPETRPLTGSGSAEAPPRPQNTSNTVGYTLVVVPGMGADRKEALRKLGLLKHSR